MRNKIALVLSGGGAKAAFQVGAERYCREVKGYRWDVIAGVSAGALNGSLMAMGRYDKLNEIWRTMSPETLYGRKNRHAVHILRQLVLRKPSFYGNELMRAALDVVDPSKMTIDMRVGAVSLVTGEYRSFRASDPHFLEAVIASAALPPVFPPVDVGPGHTSMVDGGVRKVSPVSDVLDAQPDEIVIINCSPLHRAPSETAPTTAIAVSLRAFSISMNQIFINDIKKFQLINRMVLQAEKGGVVLTNEHGRPYRRYPSILIEPDGHLGHTTDFTPAHVARAMEAGWEKAKKVLG